MDSKTIELNSNRTFKTVYHVKKTMDYITCHQRKSWPKISTAVCKKCKRKERCLDYRKYAQPTLFPDFTEPNIAKRKRRRIKTTHEMTEAMGPEQLIFDFWNMEEKKT